MSSNSNIENDIINFYSKYEIQNNDTNNKFSHENNTLDSFYNESNQQNIYVEQTRHRQENNFINDLNDLLNSVKRQNSIPLMHNFFYTFFINANFISSERLKYILEEFKLIVESSNNILLIEYFSDMYGKINYIDNMNPTKKELIDDLWPTNLSKNTSITYNLYKSETTCCSFLINIKDN